MPELTWSDVAERARAVAVRGRLAAQGMDERRAALSRSALVWWQGEAAESYQRRVHDRVNALAALSARLEAVARLADQLAADAERLAQAERASLTAGPQP